MNAGSQPLDGILAEAVSALQRAYSTAELPQALMESTRKAMQDAARAERPGAAPGARHFGAKYRRLAVAFAGACLIALAALLLSTAGERAGTAYAQVEEAIRNSSKTEWVHGMEGRTEHWFAARPPRSAWKSSTGELRYIAYESNRWVSYTPENRTITICWGRQREELEGVASLWDLLLAEVERQKEEGNLLEVSSAEVGGRPCQVFAFAGGEGDLDETRLFVDMEHHRLIRREIQPPKGEPRTVDFDYPENGPESIYDLGAPHDARIVDLTAPTEVKKLKAEVEATARAALPQYYAIVCRRMKEHDLINKGEGLPSVRASVSSVHVKGEMMRVDVYELSSPDGITYRESMDYHRKLWDQLPAEDVGALEQWIASRKPTRVVICEGGRATKIQLADEGGLETSQYTVSLAVEPYIWCLPIRLRNTRTLEPMDGEWGRLVGFESYRGISYDQWYFNPGRDYVCEFHEWGTDNQREILEPGFQAGGDPHRHAITLELNEYARTSRGVWYPRRQTQVDFMSGYGSVTYDIVNHVDDSRTIPQSVFEPSSVGAEDLSPRR